MGKFKVKAFEAPEGVTLTEGEAALMKELSDWLQKSFADFVTSQKSGEEYAAEIEKKLADSGISAEALKDFRDTLKQQGQALEKMREHAAAPAKAAHSLEKAFYDKFDEVRAALAENRVGYTVKAVDEHTAASVITTDNVTATATGAQLAERVGVRDEIFMARSGRQYIHDIADVTVTNDVPEIYTFYEEGAADGTIAVVAENGLKPQVSLSLVKNIVEQKKAAGYIVVTDEVIRNRPRAWQAIQRMFRDKVYRDYETQLTASLLDAAPAYAQTALDGTIAAPTDFHALIAAVLQVESLDFQPNVLVINPADKWRLAMTETTGGMLILPYLQQGGQFGILGLRVITTTKMEAGTFLVGEGGTWYIEESAPQLRTGMVNDDLIHNRMTIVGEIFFLSYVPSNRKGAWVKGNFATIKSALKTA